MDQSDTFHWHSDCSENGLLIPGESDCSTGPDEGALEDAKTTLISWMRYNHPDARDESLLTAIRHVEDWTGETEVVEASVTEKSTPYQYRIMAIDGGCSQTS